MYSSAQLLMHSLNGVSTNSKSPFWSSFSEKSRATSSSILIYASVPIPFLTSCNRTHPARLRTRATLFCCQHHWQGKSQFLKKSPLVIIVLIVEAPDVAQAAEERGVPFAIADSYLPLV